MALLDRIMGLFQSTTKLDGRYYGVYSGIVTDNKDPDALARVKVLVASVSSAALWARTATPMAGKQRGTWFVPEVDDEVLVAFEGGDPRRPYVVGSLWNSTATPPETMDNDNSRKSIVTRSGARIMVEETNKSTVMVLQTPAGQQVVLEDAGAPSVTIKDANGNTIVLNSSGITVNSSGAVKVQATTVDVTASMVKVNSGMSEFSGVVKCDTLIATSVVATSYTPGAGNVM
ncbi:MAG: phage baseplate assembly protein V [Anaerolineae bacterium]